MRFIAAIPLTLACFLFFGLDLCAQSVTWSNTYPNSPQAAQIAGQGTALPPAMGTLSSVTLIATAATATAGGPGGSSGTTITGGKNFSGVIIRLQKGTYRVVARMVYVKGGQNYTWDSPVIGNITVN